MHNTTSKRKGSTYNSGLDKTPPTRFKHLRKRKIICVISKIAEYGICLVIGKMFLLLSCQISRRQRVKKRGIRHRSLDCASLLTFYSASTQCFFSMKEENIPREFGRKVGCLEEHLSVSGFPALINLGLGVELRGLFFMFSRVDLVMFIILFSKPISHYYFQPIIISSLPQTHNYNNTVAPKSQHYYLVPIQ